MAGKPSSDLIETDLLLWSESADQLVKELTDPSSQNMFRISRTKSSLGPKIVIVGRTETGLMGFFSSPRNLEGGNVLLLQLWVSVSAN